jgi:tetratricopeptide (TPR) repeat protein
MWAKGYAAEETKAAFARAAELAERTDNFSARVTTLQGQFSAAATAGELRSARELALTLLREAEDARQYTEASMADNFLGLVAYWRADFIEARTHYERALTAADPNQDPQFFGYSVLASAHLAATMWQLGEIERARDLINSAIQRASETAHFGGIADVLFYKSWMEVWRDDPVATLSAAETLELVAQEHGIAQYLNEAELLSGWARGRMNDPVAGAAQVRRIMAALVEQGVRVNLGFYTGLLAQLEAETVGAETALARIDEAFRLSNEVEHRCSLPFLHRLHGEILLKRDPADPASAEEAFRTSIAVAKEQGARSPVLLASLALAKLLQSTGRPVDAHAVLTSALEGFSPTPEMPQIAEAQTLLAALVDTEEVEAAEAQRQRRLHLQTAYGQAMMWSKGFSAEETKAAFSRATELTAKTDSFADRFAAGRFQGILALTRGELRSARELALNLLKEAEDAGRLVEAGVARRGLALACYEAADFLEARNHCEQALEACDAESERETQERFRDATGPLVMSFLAVTMWQLGEVDRARELIEQANRRAGELGHPPSMAHPLLWKSHLEILRGDPAAALTAAKALDALGREHGMSFWRGELSTVWARGRLHNAATGAEDLRRAMADRIEQGALNDAWFFTALLAELEAETLGTESALARIDEAMALARQVETRCNLPFPHLLRGKLLIARDPSNPAPAEEAFKTAVEIAKQQGARCWGLRAALSLANLYQSTARPVDAHAVLASAIEGFSPTPEMPEIAEAQAVLAALAKTTEVKAAIALRQRRLDLQTSHAQALMWAKGYAAEETEAAFARVGEFVGLAENAAARFVAYYAQVQRSILRGEFRLAQETAEVFLREAEASGRGMEASVARRTLGMTLLLQGDLRLARSLLERALADFIPERDGGARFQFGTDSQVGAAAMLALAEWHFGNAARARQLSEQAVRRAGELGHAASLVIAFLWKTFLESRRNDVSATRLAADGLLRAMEGHGIMNLTDLGQMYVNWAQGRLLDPEAGVSELRRTLAAHIAQGQRGFTASLHGLLAELEAVTRGPDSALPLIDQGLSIAEETGDHLTDPYLHRLRGEILIKRDPANPVPAAEAFQTAIAVAEEQGARSYVLLASLSLAKLYQSTARQDEGYAVLAPALEGFAPTLEMPEIAEAQALLEHLARGSEGAIASKDQATKG